MRIICKGGSNLEYVWRSEPSRSADCSTVTPGQSTFYFSHSAEIRGDTGDEGEGGGRETPRDFHECLYGGLPSIFDCGVKTFYGD
ncbi:hypothetical protein PUN28_018541 [Cardiocondyla obscurior]|uniref:Uncharacterized protein n=1 Tax=Cardiocondyla obscurior TaxID=286306 RepID=A0AAW2EI69_9HYME